MPQRPIKLAVLWVIGCATAVVALDQASKAWAAAQFAGRAPTEVVGQWLRFTFVRNPGGAFSLGTDYTWVFTLAATTVTVVILLLARRLVSAWWVLALGLLLGGAVGNLLDRATQEPGFPSGYVRDFIQLPYWPVFNVADMAVVGAALLIVALSLLGVPATAPRHPAQAEAEPGRAEKPVTADG